MEFGNVSTAQPFVGAGNAAAEAIERVAIPHSVCHHFPTWSAVDYGRGNTDGSRLDSAATRAAALQVAPCRIVRRRIAQRILMEGDKNGRD
jgi:hypothetical protein